jgi:hypothetical protein
MSEFNEIPGESETGVNSDDCAMSGRSFLAQIVNRHGVNQRIKDLFAKALRAEDGDSDAEKDLTRLLVDEGYSITDDGLARSLAGTIKTVPKTIMSIAARAALKSTLN